MSATLRNRFRPKRCAAKSCQQKFTPTRTFQRTCSVPCSIEVARAEETKRREAAKLQARRERREWREKNRTTSEWIALAQEAFNAFIRERDRDLPCVSCGRHPLTHPLSGGEWDCGHYRSIGANPELRFEPLNAHKQCKRCNRDLDGNVVNYRIELLDRIGSDRLAWLEGPHEPKRYRASELEALCKHYRALARQMRSDSKLSVGAL